MSHPRAFGLLGLGYVVGFVAVTGLDPAHQKGAGIGWAVVACAEMVSLRRRLGAVSPSASQAQFAAAMVGGFLAKLMLLLGFALVGSLGNLFSAPAFLFAFLAGLLWGEFFAVLLLLRTRPSRRSPEDPPSPS